MEIYYVMWQETVNGKACVLSETNSVQEAEKSLEHHRSLLNRGIYTIVHDDTI